MQGVLLTGLAMMLMLGQQQTVPDSPQPQTAGSQQSTPEAQAFRNLTDLKQTIAPGKGATDDSNSDASTSTTAEPAAPTNGQTGAKPEATVPSIPSTGQSAVSGGRQQENHAPPEIPAAGSGPGYLIRVPVNFVEVPVTVKDKHGALVPGLTYHDFRVFENNQRQQLRYFTVDPFPLSVALVVDQSLPQDTMQKVNESLAALQGAFTPYDEIAIYTYNNGPTLRTGFTGAQSARVPATIASMKSAGRDMGVPVNSGPLATPGIIVTGQDFEHNQPMHPITAGRHLTIPKEVHTLNDAILAAAELTVGQPKGRRRIVYVISDGKEAGSKASFKDVVRYLQTHKIAVYGTLVGDSATFGVGYLDRLHLPFFLQENILPKYANVTGGQFDAEFRTNGIEKSFARIAEEVRTQYTLGYMSHEPVLDGKFRRIEVQVTRPGLTVYAKDGYYPSAQDMR